MPERNLEQTFAIAAGTVRGGEHGRLGRNNQDAFAVDVDERRLLAVVCDGCGSGRHSEVGARVGARLLLAALRRRLADKPLAPLEKNLGQVRKDVLRRLAWLARRMGLPLVQAVRDYLLFTVVGVVVEPRETAVFALGDGLAALNGELAELSFEGDRPPYLAYGLIPGALTDGDLARRGFSLLARRATADLESVLIATDGLAALPSDEREALWNDDLVLRNPQAIQRLLARLNPPRARRGTAPRLPDDTTAVVLRRRP